MLLGIFCTNLSFFNTASGIDCMQLGRVIGVDDCVAVFQYRKRYGLHAMKKMKKEIIKVWRFNTASGMDCMQ